MTTSPRVSFLFRAAALACAVFACLVPAASAAHWPGYGGDPGRSGNQPVEPGGLPVKLVWKRTAAADQGVKTSVLTTGGPVAAQRVAYGTGDGFVHLRRLTDGAPIGGADVSSDPDVFGPAGASVGLADTSTEAAPGQLLAVHNEASGIQIARFDDASGALREQFAVPGTAGMTIASSPLVTPPAADGSRSLFFVAGGRLFKVPVSAAGAFGAVTSTADVNATPLASPALVYLKVLGTPTAHVAIGTEDAALRTYRASNLAAGPAATSLPDALDVLTPIVPVQPDGRTPSLGSPIGTAPVIYVSATSLIFGPSAKVFKLRQDPSDESALELQRDAPFPGRPSPAMAVTQLAQPGDAMDDGKLLLGVSINHFLLSTRDLDVVGSFDTEFDLEGGEDGFQHTTGAVSGDLIYITNDRGQPFVVRVSDGKPIDKGAEFTPDAEATGADDGGLGQPAISHGYVQFGGPDGVFVYRNTRAEPSSPPAPADDAAPGVAMTSPAAGARLSGTSTLSANATDDHGVASVRFLAGERVICTDTTAPYSCPYTPTADDVGRTTLIAVATDGAGQIGTAIRGVRVSRFTPRSVTAGTKRRGLRFTTTGRVRRPAGLTAKQACGNGSVSVQVQAVRKTISTRRVQLSRSCTFRSRVTFASRHRFGRSGRLRVRVRFLGNAVLASRRAKTATLRT